MMLSSFCHTSLLRWEDIKETMRFLFSVLFAVALLIPLQGSVANTDRATLIENKKILYLASEIILLDIADEMF